MPYLGQMVHYGVENLALNSGKPIAPAVVVHVHNARRVNLKVLLDGTMDLWKSQIGLDDTLATEGTPHPKPNHWAPIPAIGEPEQE